MDINEREEVMTGKRQQNRSAGARPISIRALTILATVAALVVSAGPAAAYSMGPGGDRPMESVSFAKAPPAPRALKAEAKANRFVAHTRFRDAATKQIQEEQH